MISGLEVSSPRLPAAAGEVGAFEQVVGELDVRADAFAPAARASASWTASASGLGGGVGPAPSAKASAVGDDAERDHEPAEQQQA